MAALRLQSCRERVLFVVDAGPEARLADLRGCLNMFARRKLNMALHRMALVTFDAAGAVTLRCGFTSSGETFERAVEASLQESGEEGEGAVAGEEVRAGKEAEEEEEDVRQSRVLAAPSIDLTAVLDAAYLLVRQAVAEEEGVPPGARGSSTLELMQPDAYVERGVLIFARSFAAPSLAPNHVPLLLLPPEQQRQLPQKRAGLTVPSGQIRAACLDILYMHRKPTEPNTCCQDVFEQLERLDAVSESLAAQKGGSAESEASGGAATGEVKGNDGVQAHVVLPSILVETGVSRMRLLTHIAMLLAHPGQRRGQDELAGSIDVGPVAELPALKPEDFDADPAYRAARATEATVAGAVGTHSASGATGSASTSASAFTISASSAAAAHQTPGANAGLAGSNDSTPKRFFGHGGQQQGGGGGGGGGPGASLASRLLHRGRK